MRNHPGTGEASQLAHARFGIDQIKMPTYSIYEYGAKDNSEKTSNAQQQIGEGALWPTPRDARLSVHAMRCHVDGGRWMGKQGPITGEASGSFGPLWLVPSYIHAR